MLTPARFPGGSPAEVDLAAYRALSASQARNYDRSQDISPRQLVLLLEVAERTGASLGQALATGEHESARTWNDFVRPTLKSGGLGSATGVWQFQPATFHAIVKGYGAELLALSGADAATGREHLDLGDGPFTDAKVRALIHETLDGRRGPEDEELQLLRHNFAVLAFARHFLSLDNGATTPEEDYLFHFLGAAEGRRLLELARGEARHTLSVKPSEPPSDPPLPGSETLGAETRIVVREATAMVRSVPPIAFDPALDPARDPAAGLAPSLQGRREAGTLGITGAGRITAIRTEVGSASVRLPKGATVLPPLPFAPPVMSAEWGLPADSPTVTGNLGMFYRDGKGQTQPYTWAEFMDNLARRVQADRQPALVRAKYGVGFALNGGDMPERGADPLAASQMVEFRRRDGQPLWVPEGLVTGPLDHDETEHYKQRLRALVDQGDDAPTGALPPESLAALDHLGLLRTSALGPSPGRPEVGEALRAFRKRVGKDEPDDPAHANLLMPAERVALEIYDRRLARYAALQACQEASLSEAPDLRHIRKLPVGLQRPTAPYLAAVQNALAAAGLLQQPMEKHVWRDKKRRKHVTYKQVPFRGKADQATIAALNRFQMRHGLRQTDGVLDAVTLELLGLPAMGPEIFLPLSGPQCRTPSDPEGPPRCGVAGRSRAGGAADLAGARERSSPWLLEMLTACPACSVSPPGRPQGPS